ncbi:hypothetical protein Tco_0609067, partial [Tanacetum coccineum]
VSLLLKPLCCNDTHDVTPRVSALAGCDRLTDAMNQEMDALLRNGTWEIIDLPKGRKAIGRCRWIVIHIVKTSGMFLNAYSGADWAKCVITRKSATGYCVFLNDSLVFWKSKKHNTLSKSSAEAEYRALASVTSEVIWILKILKDLNIENLLPVSLHCDSNSAIKIAANSVFHERTKHLENDLHFVREQFLKGVVKTVKVESANQIADILSKGLDTVQHIELVKKLGMHDVYRKRLMGIFVTAVKLNKGLKDSNFDQLYAYLKQHEAHANENKMMLERLTQKTVDPLALMSNVSPQHYHSQSSTIPPTTYHQPHSADTSQSDLGLCLTDNLIENLTNTLALLTQPYKTFLPQINNQLRTSSNPRNQATVQDGMVVVQNVQGRQNRGQGNNARGTGAAGYGGAQNRVGNANPGQARQNSEYFKDKMLLMQAQENVVVLDEEQLLFLAGRQDNAIDEDVDEQPVQDLARNVDNVFQADDCDAYDSDVNEAPTVQTMFMAN